MLKEHEEILDRIIDLAGNCLDAALCSRCPFASRCLPEFVKTPNTRPSREERLQMALDVAARNALMDDDDFKEK